MLKKVYDWLHSLVSKEPLRGKKSSRGPWHTKVRRAAADLCVGKKSFIHSRPENHAIYGVDEKWPLSIPSLALGIFGEDTKAKPKYNLNRPQGLSDRGSRRLILEVGCGDGLFLQEAASRLSRQQFFLGLDILSEQLSCAKKKSQLANIRFIQADALRLPFKDKSLTTVVCVNTLLNLTEENALEDLLRELARVCSPQGSIIFDIRNQLNPFVYLKYKLVKYYDSTIDSRKLRAYTLDLVEKKLAGLNLKLTRKVSIGLFPGRLASILVLEAKAV